MPGADKHHYFQPEASNGATVSGLPLSVHVVALLVIDFIPAKSF